MSALVEPADEPWPGVPTGSRTVLDVVIPVHNEEAQLAASVERVLEHLRATAVVLPDHHRRQRQHRRAPR